MIQDLQALLETSVSDPRTKQAQQRYPVPRDIAQTLHQCLVSPSQPRRQSTLNLLYEALVADDPGICLLGHCLQTIGMLRRKRPPFKGMQKNNPLHGLLQSATQERKDLENLEKTVKLLRRQLEVCNADFPMALVLDPTLAGMRGMQRDTFSDLGLRGTRTADGRWSLSYAFSANSRAPSEQTLGPMLEQVLKQARERISNGKAARRLLVSVNRKNAYRVYVIRRLDQFWCQEMQLLRSEECLAEIATLVLEQLGLGADQSALNVDDVRSALKGWKS